MEVKWWIGVVENKNDPAYRGRVQVRILGIHTKETQRQHKKGVGIPMDDLPWAICCMPLTFGGIAESTVAPPAVQPGAWVLGISLDGDAYQKLMILGVISMCMSPVATHNGVDLGLAQGYQQVDNVIENTDTCEESYTKAIKNLTSSADNKLQAKNMLMVLRYIKQKQPQKYANFVRSSGIEISDDTVIAQGTTNDTVNNLLAEGYYNYCLDVCSDPVIAALAYSSGIGKAVNGYNGEQSFIDKYGDPRKREISYEDLANRIEKEDAKAAKFMRDFISQLGSSCMDKCIYGLHNTSSTQNATSSNGSVTTSTNTSTQGLRSIALPTESNVITSVYMSANRPEYGSKAHKGIDLRAPSGAAIRSMAEGTVVALYHRWGGVLIDHGFGIKTRYLHMRKTYVKVGDKVKVGEQIGESGNAGLPQSTPHLHFEVWKNDTKIDPETFLKENGIITTRKAGA
jgi:murein DD-endopeptidase MepM/ murein hydrolase activator NlpD